MTVTAVQLQLCRTAALTCSLNCYSCHTSMQQADRQIGSEPMYTRNCSPSPCRHAQTCSHVAVPHSNFLACTKVTHLFTPVSSTMEPKVTAPPRSRRVCKPNPRHKYKQRQQRTNQYQYWLLNQQYWLINQPRHGFHSVPRHRERGGRHG